MTRNEFIEQIAPIVARLAKEYGICVVSPIIAQACLESGYGSSNKAKYNNFFGLKYREGRVSCHSGTFVDKKRRRHLTQRRISSVAEIQRICQLLKSQQISSMMDRQI